MAMINIKMNTTMARVEATTTRITTTATPVRVLARVLKKTRKHSVISP